MFKLELQAHEMDLILQGIGKLPLEQSIEVYFNIRQQIAKQQEQINNSGNVQADNEKEENYMKPEDTKSEPKVKVNTVKEGDT